MRRKHEQADTPSTTSAEETAEVEGALPEAMTGFVGYLLRRLYARFAAVPAATDPRELRVLDALAQRDWLSQLELAERLGINRTVMVAVVDRLEQRGEVRRTRNEDNRRSYVLSLTDRGRNGLAACRKAVAERDAALTEALSPQETNRLNELLARLLPNPSDATHGTDYLVTQAHYRLRRLGDEKLAGTGLRVRHYGPLSILDAAGPCSQQKLAERLAITEPAASQLVDELVKASLVRRGRDLRDRRRYALDLTDQGRAALARVAQAVHALAADVTGLIGSAAQSDELRTLLLRLLDTAVTATAADRLGA